MKKTDPRLTARLQKGDIIKSVIVNGERVILFLQRGNRDKRIKIAHKGKQKNLEAILEELIALSTPSSKVPKYGKDWLENLILLSPSKVYYNITAEQLEKDAEEAEKQEEIIREIKEKIKAEQ